MATRKVGLLFYILFHFSLSQAQLTEYTPNTLLSQASIYQWTGENGMISNNITSSIQAKTGFIWITTYNGIVRFDGKNVMVFDHNNLPFLATDAFYRVYEDKRGVLWFASQGSGVVKYDGRKFSAIDSTNRYLPKSIRCLYLEENGIIWVGSNNDGLFKIENDSIYKVNSPFFDTSTISDLKKDYNNVLWISTEGNGVIKYDGKSFLNYSTADGLISNSINSLGVTKNNEMLIGTAHGLNILSAGKITSPNFLNNIPINKIIHDPQGRILIATEIGLARINKQLTHAEFADEHDGFPFARINDLSFDNEGSLWMSTGRSGLIQVKETGIVNFTTAQGLSMNRVNIVVEGPGRTFYIGSDGGDLDVYKDGEVKKINLRTSLNRASIRDILPEPNGDLWIASYEGILKVTGAKEKLYTTKDGLPANDMRRILRDKTGNLLFASRTGGVTKFKDGKIIEVYDKQNALRSNYVLAMEEDLKGNVYIGTHSGGMTILYGDGKTKTFSVTDDDAGVLIFNIHLDKDGGAWLICNTGPHYFDGTKIKKITLQGLQVGETYFDWLEDATGNAWITTNKGVLKINHKDIIQYKKGLRSSLPTKLYNNDDGMKNKECTGATRSIVSSTGKLWIPTIGGIAVFYPEKIKENKIIPPVYITSLQTDVDNITHDTVEIPPGNLRYIFNYTALSYFAPSKIQFKYKLDGLDPSWENAGTKRQAEYTNIPPGQYTFQVIACNNDGVWNEQGAAMRFTVLPFFYQTYWFYATSFIIILSILYTTYKWRISRVEKRNAELRKLNNELDSFVYSTSHDLRAPLASILGLVNLSRMEAQNKDHYINLIEKSVKKLDLFINEIIDYSKNARLELTVAAIDFAHLLSDIFDNLEYLEEKKHIKKSINISGTIPLYSDKVRLGIILSNLITNAMKYYNPNNPSPYVLIQVNTGKAGATIKVTDNGIGIAEEPKKNIFKMFYRASDKSSGSGLGLYIVKEALEKLGGRITVDSKLGIGSTFEITLPSLPRK